MNQWAQTAAAGMPLWVKAIYALGFLDMLVVAICLPLITWKLYFGNRPAKPTSLSPEQIHLKQVRERREALQHLSTPTPTVSSGGIQERTDEDSRYMPKQ